MNKYSNKLKSLKQRRNSETKNIRLESNLRKAQNTFDSALNESMMSSYYSEDYELINKSDSLKYALGAMKAVPEKYTQKSFSEGERVIEALRSRFQSIPKSMELGIRDLYQLMFILEVLVMLIFWLLMDTIANIQEQELGH